MASLITVIFRHSLDAGVVGLSLTYAAGITKELKKLTRITSKLASDIVSVERLKDYDNKIMADEQNKILPLRAPAKTWPSSGTIEMRGYSTKYRPKLGFALKDIDLSIKVNYFPNIFQICK